jgi:hypothetical protein
MINKVEIIFKKILLLFEVIKWTSNLIIKYLIEKKSFQIFLLTIYIISNILYVTAILIGSLNINECTIQQYIPIWYLYIYIYLFFIFINFIRKKKG